MLMVASQSCVNGGQGVAVNVGTSDQITKVKECRNALKDFWGNETLDCGKIDLATGDTLLDQVQR